MKALLWLPKPWQDTRLPRELEVKGDCIPFAIVIPVLFDPNVAALHIPLEEVIDGVAIYRENPRPTSPALPVQ